MKDIIIVCAGSTGLEVYDLVRSINADLLSKGQHCAYNIIGFIDDNPHMLEGIDADIGIIGGIKDWKPTGNEVYALGNSSPRTKERLSVLLKPKGAWFETLISPYARVNSACTLGEGCIVMGGSSIGRAVLGDFVTVQSSMIGPASVGDFCTTTGYANITNATLGNRVFVGSQAVVLNNRRIGDDAFICAGSIVVRSVKTGEKVMGNPARRLDI